MADDEGTAMSVHAWQNAWILRFERAGIADTQIETGLLLEAVVGVPRLRLRAEPDQILSAGALQALERMANRRLRGEPLQYILGNWPFLDLTLEVGPGVLIPRPETEDWVDRLRRGLLIKGFGPDHPALRFADIGTGTGAIGLALAQSWPRSRGILTDLSPDALRIARRNVARYPGLADRLSLVRGDLSSCFREAALDLVVANLPYVDSADIPSLQPEVRDHEPRIALDGGRGGTAVIARLLSDAGRVMRPGGMLFLEHGHGQRPDIAHRSTPALDVIAVLDDAAGQERCIAWVRKSGCVVECPRPPWG